MNQINEKEYKNILIDILKYFDKICRENDINYSLIGGSLIGAIRHKGIIPWDDDIDVIIKDNDFEKLVKAFENEKNDVYELLFYNCNNEYNKPYAKIINKKTFIKEEGFKQLENYGVFIDVLTYCYVPNNSFLRKIHYIKLKINMIMCIQSWSIKHYKSIIKELLTRISKKIGTRFWVKKCIKISQKNKKETNYIMSNWVAYGYKNEIQNSSDFKEFVDVEFEGINVMITKNYDNILKNTFGDYMVLPPEEKRVSHSIKAFWK